MPFFLNGGVMKYPLINKFAAPIILIVFTINSCNFFSTPDHETSVPDRQSEIMTVPIGKGDIQVVYLDENYQPTINDIGKMALYVENNELAQGVMVTSEIRDNNIYNDVVVRVINRQNNSLASFFYYSGQRFPYKVVLSMDGEDVNGKFSLYDHANETYSVEFSNDNGEREQIENLILNRNAFSLHEDSDDLTETQNVRLRNIITTLALWNSLAVQIDDDFSIAARGVLSSIKKLVVGVLVAVAVVALVVVVVLAPPAAVAIAGPALTVAITTVAQVIAAGIALAAAAVAILAGILMPDKDSPHDLPVGSPSQNKSIMVEIALVDDIKIMTNSQTPPEKNERLSIIFLGSLSTLKNDQKPPNYLKQGESLTFSIKITDLPSGIKREDLIDEENIIFAFDPYYKKYINYKGTSPEPNARYFDVSTAGSITNNNLQITIAKNNRNGYDEDGEVQFIICFRQNVIFNNVKGVYFQESPEAERKSWENIFILNFTAKAKDPEGV